MSSQHEISEYIDNLPLQKTLCKGFRPDDVYDVICNISSMYNQLLSEVYSENDDLKRKIENMEMESRFARKQTLEPIDKPSFWGQKPAEELAEEVAEETARAEKDIQKLKRGELLEILLEQSKANEALKLQLEAKEKEIAELGKRLEERKIDILEAGSIAEASLKLNGVFRAAENAAQQYLENLQDLYDREEEAYLAKEAEIEAKCASLFNTTQRQCDFMKEETLKQCELMEANVRKQCEEMLQAAEQRCREREREYEERLRVAKPVEIKSVGTTPNVETEYKSDVDRRWEELSKRLESFYSAHQGTREILGASSNY